MYVTRPLSMYRRDRKSLSLATPEGPNSGYLVVFDEEAETHNCFGLCKESLVSDLPLPQNKLLEIEDGDYSVEALFIPALDLPLSSNRYYAMVMQRGKHQGEAYTSSKEEDTRIGFFGSKKVKDVKPRPLDPSNMYQQFEIVHKKDYGFSAKSIASDGFPPQLLRHKYWSVRMETPRPYQLLDDAQGIDSSLRASLPELGSREVVGTWYCPFMFVTEEGIKVKEKMKNSMFYKVTLEQRWEKIFECDNLGHDDDESTVLVDAVVVAKDVNVAGMRAARARREASRVVYFESSYDGIMRVGLSIEVIERMKWEQEKVGWVCGDSHDGKVRVNRAQQFHGIWTKFECHMLVESFVFKRMDSSLVLSYDFNHTHQIRSKWG